jgi:hypothetical protein
MYHRDSHSIHSTVYQFDMIGCPSKHAPSPGAPASFEFAASFENTATIDNRHAPHGYQANGASGASGASGQQLLAMVEALLLLADLCVRRRG